MIRNQFEPTSEVIKRIEDEFGEPFYDIVKGFADSGESRNSTALMLGTTLARLKTWLRDHGEGIEWGKGEYSNARIAAAKEKNYSEQHRQAARRNLRIAHERNTERFSKHRRTSPELMARAIELNKQGVSWRAMPKALGVQLNPSSLQRCYKKYYRN